MRISKFPVVIALALVVSAAPAGAATSPSAAKASAVAGCAQVQKSLQLNVTFMGLPTAKQTAAETTRVQKAERAAMSAALAAFKVAAKADKKYQALADNTKIQLDTGDASSFVKAFNSLVMGCAALKRK